MFFFKKEPKDMEMLLPKEYNKSICEVRSLTSQCGLMFECENTFAVGDELQINMTLLHNELEVLHLIIRREVERPAGKKGYGCDIVDMSPRVEQRLTAFVMEEQQQSLRRSRR